MKKFWFWVLVLGLGLVGLVLGLRNGRGEAVETIRVKLSRVRVLAAIIDGGSVEKPKKIEAPLVETKSVEKPPTPPPDPYEWLNDPPPGTPQPPLNIVLDCTRPRGWVEHELYLFSNMVFRAAKSECRYRAAMLEMIARELDNANLLVLPNGESNPYTEEEHRLVRKFIEDGGTAVVRRDDMWRTGSWRDDFCRRYEVTIRTWRDNHKGEWKICAPSFQGFELENMTNDYIYVVDIGASTNWVPVVMNESEGKLAAVAYRKVGKGRIVFLSNRFAINSFWYSDWNDYNLVFLGKLFDACARKGKQIVEGETFGNTDLREVPVQCESHGIKILACERLREGARVLKELLDVSIPLFNEEIGNVGINGLSNRVYVVADSRDGCSMHHTNWQILPGTMVSTVPAPIGDTKWSVLVHRFALNHHYMPNCIFGDKWQLQFTMEYMIGRNVAIRLGANNEDVKKADLGLFSRIDYAERLDPGLTNYWFDGMPKDEKSGRKQLHNRLDRENLQYAQSKRVLEEMCTKRKDALAEFYRIRAKLIRDGRLRGGLTVDQVAAIFSRVVGEDVFPLFEKYGFRVNRRRGRFPKRPEKRDLRTLDEVDGKKAIVDVRYGKFELAKGVVLELVGCPAGVSGMGCRDDGPDPMWRHRVAISESFWIGKYQVTKGQWAAIMGPRKYDDAEERDYAKALGGNRAAADRLTHAEIMEFCERLNDRFGHKIPFGYLFRPPTEAEWEYACRAGDDKGSYRDAGRLTQADIAKICHTRPESVMALRELGYDVQDYSKVPMFRVGTKMPNRWGIHDMLGNGWEMTYDTFSEDELLGDKKSVDRVALSFAFNYHPLEQDPYRACPKDEKKVWVAWRGMNYVGEECCTKAVFPAQGKGKAADIRRTFRVCLGPDLTDALPIYKPTVH